MAGHSDPPTPDEQRDTTTGTVEALFIAPESGAPPESRSAVEIRPEGVEGDRYRLGEGHFQLDGCPVTLVATEAVEAVRSETGIDVSDGRHRRNVVVEGFGAQMDGLLEATVAVGGAVLRPTRRRPPCARVEELAGADGLASALKRRGGLCCDVVEPGRVAVGDPVSIREPNPQTAGAAIADRLRERSNGRSAGDAFDRDDDSPRDDGNSPQGGGDNSQGGGNNPQGGADSHQGGGVTGGDSAPNHSPDR